MVPDKYYATSVLKAEGFSRKHCSNCRTYFWPVTDDNVCGNPACSGGFRFIGNTPVKNHYDLILLDIMMPDMSGWDVFKTLTK